MGRQGCRAYLGFGVVAVLGYQFLPEGTWLPAGWQVAIAYVAATVAIVGSRKLPRPERPVWFLVACGVACNASGILANAYLSVTNPDAPLPNLADAFFLTIYPTIGLALLLGLRLRPPPSFGPALFDSATVTAGLSLLAWVYTIDPALDDLSVTLSARIVRIAYPIGDIALLAVAMVLVRGAPLDHRGRRTGSAPMLLFAVLGIFTGDLIWLVLGTVGVSPGLAASRVIDSVFQCGFLIFGYAARRAAADREPGVATDGEPGTAGRRRIIGLAVLLGAALIIAPAVLVGQIRQGVPDALAIALGSSVMSVLVVTRMARLLGATQRQANRVRELSRRDDLTGVANRRAWTSELDGALESARRRSRPVSIGMIDLDHFKQFNDRYGHPAGDRLLKEATAAWQGLLRDSDVLARYGGEEFIVLLPGASLEQARVVLDRARAATPSGQSFSAGVATWNFTETAEELVARADVALYAAKSGGRDRVETAS